MLLQTPPTERETMKKLIYFIILLFVSNAYGLSQEDLLKPDEAFNVSEPVYDSSGNISATWKIADEYYLYKKTFKFKANSDNIELGEPIFPTPERHRDITQGKMVDIFRKEVTVNIPVKTTDGSELPAEIKIQTTHQGCYDGGVCYPPKKIDFTLAKQEGGTAPVLTAVDNPQDTQDNNTDETDASSSDAAAPETSLIKKMGFESEKDKQPIPVEEAFQFDLQTTNDGKHIAKFSVTPGHYLYKEKIKFKLLDADDLKLGEITYPKTVIKNDAAYGEIEVYKNDFDIEIPLKGEISEKAKLFVEYQGCSELTGICYPPVKVTVPILGGSVKAATDAEKNATQTAATPAAAEQTEQDIFADKLKNSSFFAILAVFFVAGLGLALTPCVFPMIPILSGIIAGQSGYLSTRRSFMLSLAYVLPMATTYALVGVIAGLSAGAINLQVIFQTPWVIVLFAIIFVLLSLSMFGFYELQMPGSIQSRLTEISNRQEGGNIVGVAIMGILSAIIVGPCVTAPLIGALIYIAETGDAVLGGSALFALGMGMGTPLLIIGTSAGKLLPRAGAWMDTTKAIFGVMMLGLAIWMLDRIVPGEVTLLLTGILLVVSSLYTGTLERITEETSNAARFFKGIGIVMFVFGIMMLIGSATGNTSLTQPLKNLFTPSSVISGSASNVPSALNFKHVKGIAGLESALAQAKNSNKISMLDFYADWCTSCKELEHITFADPRVISGLQGINTMQADVTANDDQDKALMQKFSIIAPPVILFFKPDGTELKNYRLVGYHTPDAFLAHLAKIHTATGL